MRRFVNGSEVVLEPSAGITVNSLGDRMIVYGPSGAESAVSVRVGDTVLVSYQGRQFKIEKAVRTASSGAKGSGQISAPMPGLIVDVLVAEGAFVEKGQKLVVLEAMKTQQAFTSPFPGEVKLLKVQPGDQVVEGQLLVEVVGG